MTQFAVNTRLDRKGFSLIELLVVMSLISLLTGLAFTALSGLGKGAQLTYSGNQIVNLINRARQNSMSKNVITALVVVTDPSLSKSNQAIMLMELKQTVPGIPVTSADWKQVTKWEPLANGAVVDRLVSFETAQPKPAFPDLKYGNTSVNPSSYSYIVFLPGGNLLGGTGVSQIRLTEGFFAQGESAPVLTRLKPDGQSANAYEITIVGATGRTMVDRL